MKNNLLHHLIRTMIRPIIGLALACVFVLPATARDDDHYIYTLDNAVADTRVVVIEHNAGGSLVAIGSVSTQGKGSGANLGSQGSLALSSNGRWLFAVSAGSNQITTFAIDGDELTFVSTVPSGGTMPISVTSHGKLVYVLNAGGAGNITGFELDHRGTLAPIAGSTQSLGGAATGPAEIKFTQDGEHLVVSEKTANALLVFELADGVAQPGTFNGSVGNVPFGFDIDARDHVIVSEAQAGTVSSYELRERTGNLAVITASTQTHQGAPCWLILTPNGRYAYTGNAGTSTITGFSVTHAGLLNILAPSGLNASTGSGSHTIDLATSADGKFLYALANVGQSVTAFRIGRDGSLTRAGDFSGVPVSTVGLVAR